MESSERNANAPHSFERIERKFVITPEERAELIPLLEDRASPCYPDTETSYTKVESIYFDSSDLRIFSDHFALLNERFKVRTRAYGPNGIWDRDSVYFELKTKRLEWTEKFRIRLDAITRANVSECGPNPPRIEFSRELHRMNSSLELRELLQRVHALQECVARLKLRPISRVVYDRQAYEGENIRFTLDQNISSELLQEIPESTRIQSLGSAFWPQAEQLIRRYAPARSVIFEVKSKGALPAWIDRFLKTRSIGETRFSKYCYSIAKDLSEMQSRSLCDSASSDSHSLRSIR